MQGGGESTTFDQLLLTLFRSIHATSPWSEFLEALCVQFQGCTATLVLRQPARGDRGDMFDVNATPSLFELYRTANFADDPFLDLEEGEWRATFLTVFRVTYFSALATTTSC